MLVCVCAPPARSESNERRELRTRKIPQTHTCTQSVWQAHAQPAITEYTRTSNTIGTHARTCAQRTACRHTRMLFLKQIDTSNGSDGFLMESIMHAFAVASFYIRITCGCSSIVVDGILRKRHVRANIRHILIFEF